MDVDSSGVAVDPGLVRLCDSTQSETRSGPPRILLLARHPEEGFDHFGSDCQYFCPIWLKAMDDDWVLLISFLQDDG